MNKTLVLPEDDEATANTASNVIQLPTRITDIEFANIENSRNLIIEKKKEYCDEVLEYSLEHFFNCLDGFGIKFDNNRMNAKQLVMLEEICQAILYQYYGIEHPFQNIAEELISVVDDEPIEEGVDEDE